MSEDHLSLTRRIVNSVWKAVRVLEERPASSPKVKLHGRRGYGDQEIPSPERKRDGE